MKIFIFLGLICFSPFALSCTPVSQPPYDSNSYYSSIANQTGEDLKAALNTIIKDHTVYSYSPCTWTILEQADEDPIDNNSVTGFYTRRSILKANRDMGGNTPDAWNREHVWPRSHGFPSSNQHAHNDVHALRATDKSVNADREDHDFAEGGSPDSECSGCYEGNGTWEPPDLVKGDTARMMFYMDVRYQGNDTSGVSDLELVDVLTSSGQNLMGKTCELVQWHLADPVSAEEYIRNNVVYSWQGNRNPFIDHPEYVVLIWGEGCGISPPVTPVPYPNWFIPGLIILFLHVKTILIANRKEQHDNKIT